MEFFISKFAIIVILSLLSGMQSAIGIRFVIDREECFSHSVPYEGDNVQVSFVVIKADTTWHFGDEGVDLVIHTKRRNHLEQKRLNDLVYVRYNQILHHRYQKRDNIYSISLKDIDESNEWLIWMMNSLDEGGDDASAPDLVFPGEDLDWAIVTEAMGVDEPRARTRAKGKTPASTSTWTTTNVYQRRGRARLTQVEEEDDDDEEEEEEEEEFVGDDDTFR